MSPKLIKCATGLIINLFVSTKALSLEERKAFHKKLIEGCQPKEGASDSDVNTLLNRDIPTTPAGKCLIACSYEAVGLLADGKFSQETAIEIAKTTYEGSEKALALVKDLGPNCGSITGDRCEMAAKLMECMQETARKNGVDPKNM